MTELVFINKQLYDCVLQGNGQYLCTPRQENVEFRTLPQSGSNVIQTDLNQGVTYAYQIPASGLTSLSPEGAPPLMGTGANWEVSISKQPGDWAAAKEMGKTTNPKDGSVNTPYYASQGGQSGGLKWSVGDPTSIDWAANPLHGPVVPTNEKWYLNLRITTPTKPDSNAINLAFSN